MASRREPRVRCVLPVKVAGADAHGNRFERLTCTLDISDTGARITGIPDELREGLEVEVSYKNRRENFRIAWIGRSGTRTENQIGLISDAKSEFWPELRKHLSKPLAEDYAERERQAQQHARQAVARFPTPGTLAIGNRNSPTERLRAATEEMFDLARLIEHGSVEPAALQEFRQALGYVRNTSWILQQWFELQKGETGRLPLLTMLNTERMRLAASLCTDLSTFLATTEVDMDTGLLEHFLRVVKPLMAILSARLEERIGPAAADTARGTA